jgi:hypothetical protein
MKIEAYFADTNAFLYLLERKPFILPFTDTPWHFSVITEVELLGWHKITRRDVGIIQAALSFCVRHPITDNILRQTIGPKADAKVENDRCIYCCNCYNLANAFVDG